MKSLDVPLNTSKRLAGVFDILLFVLREYAGSPRVGMSIIGACRSRPWRAGEIRMRELGIAKLFARRAGLSKTLPWMPPDLYSTSPHPFVDELHGVINGQPAGMEPPAIDVELQILLRSSPEEKRIWRESPVPI